MANRKGHSTTWTCEGTYRKQDNGNTDWRGRKTGCRPPPQRKRDEDTGRAGPSPEENGHNLWGDRLFWEEAPGEATASGAQ